MQTRTWICPICGDTRCRNPLEVGLHVMCNHREGDVLMVPVLSLVLLKDMVDATEYYRWLFSSEFIGVN